VDAVKHPPDDRPLTIGDALEQINRALQECLAALGLPPPLKARHHSITLPGAVVVFVVILAVIGIIALLRWAL